MYYDNNPSVIEANDIISVKGMSFTPGDESTGTMPELKLTLSLVPHKPYNPTALHLTDGVSHRILTPLPPPSDEASASDGESSIELEPPPTPAPLRKSGTSSRKSAKAVAASEPVDSSSSSETLVQEENAQNTTTEPNNDIPASEGIATSEEE